MLIGHYVVAFAAAAHPKAPKLGVLFVAAQLTDIAFFLFVMGGIEHMRITLGTTASNNLDLFYMPYTHSLLGILVWAASYVLVSYVGLKNWAAELIGGAVVTSHWLIDVPVHTADMSIADGPPKFGLALWDSPMIEMPLEIGLVLGSAWYYAGATASMTGKFGHSLTVLVGVLLAAQIWNWFGPQPSAMSAEVPISALIAYALFAGIAHWVARSRTHRAKR